MDSEPSSESTSWLNRTTLGIRLTSLFSDWSHEIATAILPAFLASLGVAPGWLRVIEGTADGLSSFSRLAAGALHRSLGAQKASGAERLRSHDGRHGGTGDGD